MIDLLRVLDPSFDPSEAKIHFAQRDGADKPLDVYLAGQFEEWQRWQSQRNFSRKRLISLIDMGAGRWLFAGVHLAGEAILDDMKKEYRYETVEESQFHELNGRLVVRVNKDWRQSYVFAENYIDMIDVDEIMREPMSIGEFPGFKAVHLTWDQLSTVVRGQDQSWRSALSSVAGIYLITDETTGKFYVGSACGQGGIWQRWCDYASTGHGDNVELKRLLAEAGEHKMRDFRYAILEVADVNADNADILTRESHWKNVLLSRRYGLNRN
ncbi:MAG TPA: GIY-YIG nuclease family protein [Burkholderiaceae bacterium]|nr:GIY-YIG nuclease family protein [Burkholderiaceae bacterium]